jgi:hypothetical protein
LWNFVAMVQRNRRVRPDDAMLERFIELADGSATDILRYARHYGVLMICEHELPATHLPTKMFNKEMGCRPLGYPTNCWEPLEQWRHFAREARSMLQIANQLRRGFNGNRADWERISGVRPRQYVPKGLNPATEKFFLGEVIEEWLRLGDVHAKVQWRNDELRPVIGFAWSGLFGALAVQLALSVAGVDGWAICEACHIQYVPRQRRPKAGQRNFCLKCRKQGVPKRYALQDYRRRKREQSGPSGKNSQRS